MGRRQPHRPPPQPIPVPNPSGPLPSPPGMCVFSLLQTPPPTGRRQPSLSLLPTGFRRARISWWCAEPSRTRATPHAEQRSSIHGTPGWWAVRRPHFGQMHEPAAPIPPPPPPPRPPPAPFPPPPPPPPPIPFPPPAPVPRVPPIPFPRPPPIPFPPPPPPGVRPRASWGLACCRSCCRTVFLLGRLADERPSQSSW